MSEFNITAGTPCALRFYFFDQPGSTSNGCNISTQTRSQAFGLGSLDGTMSYGFINLPAPGASLWTALTGITEKHNVWQRCEVFYDGETIAMCYIDGVLVNERTDVVKFLRAAIEDQRWNRRDFSSSYTILYRRFHLNH